MNYYSIFRPAVLITVLALAGSTALTSCQKDVVLKTLDVKLVKEVVLDIDADDSLAGAWTRELVPNDNTDINDNRRKIKKVVIERLSYRVNQFIGAPDTKGSGTWKFYLTDTPAEVFALGTVTNLDLKVLADNGTVSDLAISEDGKAKIVDAINSNRAVTFVFDGNVTTRPSYTRFELQIFTKVDVGV